MKVYLDNCCFNRPYDDQDSLRIRIETEVKLEIQKSIRAGEIELVWSYVLDFENALNPFEERREEIFLWQSFIKLYIEENEEIISKMHILEHKGLKSLDALHIACAIEADCDYFITVDKGILKKRSQISEIIVINPIDFFEEQEIKDND